VHAIEMKNSIRIKFMVLLLGTLIVSTVLISTVIAINEKLMLERSLTSKGLSLATNIARRNENALIIKGSTRLDTVLSELITDEEVVYTVIKDAQGKLLTTQFESMNFKWPGLKEVLPDLSKDLDMPEIITEINRKVRIREISVPIVVSSDIFGTVTIGMSENRITKQVTTSLLFLFSLNVMVAVVLGTVLFAVSKKMLFDPIAELVRAVTRISQGDLSAHVEAETTGEMKVLLDSFNQMAHELDRTTVSREYMNDIVKSMTESLIVLTPELSIRDANPASLRLLGYAREELLDQHIDMILDGEIASSLTDRIQARLGIDTETWICKKDGRIVPVSFTASDIRNHEGSIKGIVCVMSDISERKENEQALIQKKIELERSNTELQHFAYIASHDLQEPLRKVTAFGGRLQDKYAEVLGEQGLDYLNRMQGAARRMQSLINDLLTFSRVSTKTQAFETVNLRQVALDVVSDLEMRIEQTNAVVEIGELPVVDADPLQMRQLFQNIIANSLKFHKPGIPPHITIECHQHAVKGEDHDVCEIMFADNGIGFDVKYTDRIFEVFQRLHGRNEYEGTGIGLAICRKIAERHSGRIEAKSVPAEGSKFIISLPMKQSKEERYYGEAA
jgi:PAS domain S-box-containing protein